MNRKQVALNSPNIEACLKKFEITTCCMEGEMKGSNRVTKVLELNNEYVIELLYTTKNEVSGHKVIFLSKIVYYSGLLLRNIK